MAHVCRSWWQVTTRAVPPAPRSPGGLNGGQQPVTEPGRAQTAAARGEQEAGKGAGARVRDRAVPSALLSPLVESGERDGVERDHALGGELAQRDLQPGAGGAVVDDAADLQVEKLADPQPRTAQDSQADAGERVVEARDGVHEGGIDVGRERTRQRLVELGDIGGEYQPPRWRVGPAPGGDVVEHVAQAEYRGLRHGSGDDAALACGGPLAAPGAGAVPG